MFCLGVPSLTNLPGPVSLVSPASLACLDLVCMMCLASVYGLYGLLAGLVWLVCLLCVVCHSVPVWSGLAWLGPVAPVACRGE